MQICKKTKQKKTKKNVRERERNRLASVSSVTSSPVNVCPSLENSLFRLALRWLVYISSSRMFVDFVRSVCASFDPPNFVVATAISQEDIIPFDTYIICIYIYIYIIHTCNDSFISSHPNCTMHDPSIDLISVCPIHSFIGHVKSSSITRVFVLIHLFPRSERERLRRCRSAIIESRCCCCRGVS